MHQSCCPAQWSVKQAALPPSPRHATLAPSPANLGASALPHLLQLLRDLSAPVRKFVTTYKTPLSLFSTANLAFIVWQVLSSARATREHRGLTMVGSAESLAAAPCTLAAAPCTLQLRQAPGVEGLPSAHIPVFDALQCWSSRLWAWSMSSCCRRGSTSSTSSSTSWCQRELLRSSARCLHLGAYLNYFELSCVLGPLRWAPTGGGWHGRDKPLLPSTCTAQAAAAHAST